MLAIKIQVVIIYKGECTPEENPYSTDHGPALPLFSGIITWPLLQRLSGQVSNTVIYST